VGVGGGGGGGTNIQNAQIFVCRKNENTRAVRKVFSHFEYLDNRSRGLDVTWQPDRGDLTVHP